jgi:hypothetical protein
MSDKASPRGWLIRATTKRPDGGTPSVELFEAAILDRNQAVAEVAAICGAGPDTLVEVVEQLFATDVPDGSVRSR